MELTMEVVRQCAQNALQNKPWIIDAMECEIMNAEDDLCAVDNIVSQLLRSEDAVDNMHDDTKSALGPSLVNELNRLSMSVAASRDSVSIAARKMRKRVKWLKATLGLIRVSS